MEFISLEETIKGKVCLSNSLFSLNEAGGNEASEQSKGKQSENWYFNFNSLYSII